MTGIFATVLAEVPAPLPLTAALTCSGWPFRCRTVDPAPALDFLLLLAAAEPLLVAAPVQPSVVLLLLLLLVMLLARETVPVVAAIMACLIRRAGSVTAARLRTARCHSKHTVLQSGNRSMPVSSSSAAMSSMSENLGLGAELPSDFALSPTLLLLLACEPLPAMAFSSTLLKC